MLYCAQPRIKNSRIERFFFAERKTFDTKKKNPSFASDHIILVKRQITRVSMSISIIDDIVLARRTILRRVPLDEISAPPALLDSIERMFGARLTPAEAVGRIIRDVRERGDAALYEWSAKLDGARDAQFEVPRARLQHAAEALDPELLGALQLAAGEIERFHRKQARNSWVDFNVEGALGQIVVPLQRVGLYAPGGSAPLPSSLLMAAIPARVAGVEEIVVCSPPQRATGEVAGPGNLFVVLAKRAVYGVVGIEALPGPTETLVIADDTADPRLAAADLLAQAEHDLVASAIMLTPSRAVAAATQAEVARQLEALERAEIAAQSIAQRGGIVVVADLDEAFALANAYAPEHLCLLLQEPWQHVGKVRNAGGIFLGERSFEVLGDYAAGPSHIMPTGGTARYASPVNVDDFRKIISLVGLNEAALRRIGPAAARLAEAEGLTGHAAAVRARLESSEF